MDRADFGIIASLQEQGRLTNVELARINRLAPSTTLERVRRLEERGVIRGYRAILDPVALGYQVQAMVMVTLNRHEAGSIDAFEESIKAVPEVKAGFHLTGQYDYMLHVVARDIDHLRELVTKNLAGLRGIEKQETFLVLSTVKEDQGYVLDQARAEPNGPNQEA